VRVLDLTQILFIDRYFVWLVKIKPVEPIKEFASVILCAANDPLKVLDAETKANLSDGGT